MACDYSAIRRDNERRYGTDIGRIGPMLLADRYECSCIALSKSAGRGILPIGSVGIDIGYTTGNCKIDSCQTKISAGRATVSDVDKPPIR
jgi:hypothetical protein